ncbi:MAG: EscR/YscR/HrcR family type III secretion system export apparatus protein [Bryobacteraceae bacterium]
MIRALAMLLLLAPALLAQSGGGGTLLPNPIVMVIVLGALSLAPFVLIMLTSFVKISVVLSILRNALGTQQVPPNQVITGLAFVLSIFVMVPVARQMYDSAGNIGNTGAIFSEGSVKSIFDGAKGGKEPLRRFLSRHAHATDRVLFMELAARLERATVERERMAKAAKAAPSEPRPSEPRPSGSGGSQSGSAAQPPPAPPPAESIVRLDKDDFQVLIPAFVTSELKEAFQIGFLIFVPFIIIDMVVANILLAMGMSMLSPSVISLPFKLLLFVLVDGWFMIIRGLVLSYV